MQPFRLRMRSFLPVLVVLLALVGSGYFLGFVFGAFVLFLDAFLDRFAPPPLPAPAGRPGLLLVAFAEGYWMPEAEIKFELSVVHDGTVHWRQTCRASGSASMPRFGGADGYKAALEEGMENALDFVTADIVQHFQALDPR